MEIIDRRIEPLIQVIRWQNIRLRRTLKEMSQYDQYAGNDFSSSTHFFLFVPRSNQLHLWPEASAALRYEF